MILKSALPREARHIKDLRGVIGNFVPSCKEPLSEFYGDNPEKINEILKLTSSFMKQVPESKKLKFENGLEKIFKKVKNDTDLSRDDQSTIISNYVLLQIEVYNNNKESEFDKIARIGSIVSTSVIFILLANLLSILSIEKNTRKQ